MVPCSSAWFLAPQRDVVRLLTACLFATAAAGQCAPVWLPGMPVPGVVGAVKAMVAWDRDGSGPLPAVLAVAGSIAIAGGVPLQGVAIFDPISRVWSALTPSTGVTNGSVNALVVLPNGYLVAAGTFTSMGGVAANRIAQWNGTAWQPLGSGLDGQVSSLAVMANGHLVASGGFSSAGAVPVNRLAAWDGAAWSDLGSGLSNVWVGALLVHPNGNLLAAGSALVGPTPLGPVLSFDGSSWSSLGSTLLGQVTCLALEPNGNVLAAGDILGIGNEWFRGVARWDGAIWRARKYPPFVSLTASCMIAQPGGVVYVAGRQTYYEPNVARWDGAAWTVGALTNTISTPGQVNAAAPLPGGQVAFGGEFVAADGDGVANVAAWDGTSWTALGDGPVGQVVASATLPNGDLVVGGSFTRMGDSTARYVARFDGVHWHPLGAGLDGPVRALQVMPNGDLVAGGWFTVPSPRVARWDGTSWLPMAGGLPGSNSTVRAFLLLPNGDLLAGGAYIGGVARWNGASWLNTGSVADVNALHTLADGSVVAAVADGVFRWNGSTSWSRLGWAFDGPVYDFDRLPDGQLVAAGSFSVAGSASANSVARWNGTLWWPVGAGMTGYVPSITVLPDGDIVATGQMGVAGAGASLARLDGNQWSRLASMGPSTSPGMVDRLPDGDLLVGGGFVTVDGVVRASLARLTTPCPAIATPFGAGCTGSGGANVLEATSLPWLGATFHGRATGMPANGPALVVHGLAAAVVPLATLLPQAANGCVLHTTPDLLAVAVPVAGAVATSLQLPASAALAGQVVFEQVVAFDLAGGSLAQVTSTNRLTLTLGMF